MKFTKLNLPLKVTLKDGPTAPSSQVYEFDNDEGIRTFVAKHPTWTDRWFAWEFKTGLAVCHGGGATRKEAVGHFKDMVKEFKQNNPHITIATLTDQYTLINCPF